MGSHHSFHPCTPETTSNNHSNLDNDDVTSSNSNIDNADATDGNTSSSGTNTISVDTDANGSSNNPTADNAASITSITSTTNPLELRL